MGRYLLAIAIPAVLATYIPFCTPALQPTMLPWNAPLSSLWRLPTDLSQRDLFNGPWGAERAPDPHAVYTLVEVKHHGSNPGMTVRDGKGRKWSVKQAPLDGLPAEGPVEVAVSRVLSAIGYHQPPVYYLPEFTLSDDWGSHVERGGRFRLSDKSLKDRGEWSWQQNPFVGMRPYQGLLVTLLLFNSSDFKNSNNTLYDHRVGDRVEPWYVVRDLGMALGDTGRIAPMRNDPDLFSRSEFILGIENGFVRFHYHGWHQELVRDRIEPDDVRFATELLSQLTDRQWSDAFRAAGYLPAVADTYIRALNMRVTHAKAVACPHLAAAKGR
jgi:hypothetical protein